MAVLALLEDIANGRIRNERVFRDYYDFLAHDDDWLISRFRFPRAVLLEICTELGFGEADDEESRIASSNTSPYYAWFSSNWIIPEGIG
ncbi:hypothetical protein N1851_014363 [Merluccius polli]|uniref:Uncharacterized protein n=1 Tax=Merluccius polli TaxID=89951 RepID=A0AA47MUD0_MERPO|nr:hypothetical protein N1851_014363 [Merluccius polli]